MNGFAAVAVFAVLLLFSFVELNSLSADMVTMEREMVELKSEEAVLRAQYELSYDLGFSVIFYEKNGKRAWKKDKKTLNNYGKRQFLSTL